MNNPNFKHLAESWRYAFGKPLVSATLRSTSDDFNVVEYLSFVPSGQGEHVYLFVEKRDMNTMDVAIVLSKFVGIKLNQIAYAGLKDRHAVTSQWFSICITGHTEPEWCDLQHDKITVKEVTRHNKKLKRGAIKKNQFSILLRNLNDSSTSNRQSLNDKIELIQHQGVPNYFGEQRFGRNYQNLQHVQTMSQGIKTEKNRYKRGLYYSAARSFVFNEVLSLRILENNWDTAIAGDVMSLNGSRSCFDLDAVTTEIRSRVTENDIHPSGPLIGAGQTRVRFDALALEQKCLTGYKAWEDWLTSERVAVSRRSLRLIPTTLEWTWSSDTALHLVFSLPSGAYATSVLRELVSYKSADD